MVTKKNYFNNVKDLAQLGVRYKQLSKLHHPDAGGDESTMKEINQQREAAARMLMKGKGLSDSDIDTAFQSDEWQQNAAQFGRDIMAGGNIVSNLKGATDSFVQGLLDGDEKEFTNEKGEIDPGKVMNAAFMKIFGTNPFEKKNIGDQDNSDQKKLGQ